MTVALEARVLWIFSRRLAYLGVPQDPGEPRAALAAWLLGPDRAGRARRSPPWSAIARIGRARELLVACLVERDPRRRAALERWVEAEWAWLLSSSAARAVLVAKAHSLGSSDAEGDAAEVLDRQRDLIPLLRLRLALAARAQGSGEIDSLVSSLLEWTVGASLAGQIVDAYLLLLDVARERRAWPTTAVDESVRAIAAATPDGAARRRLLGAYVEAHLVANQADPGASLERHEERADALEESCVRVEPHRRLIEAAAFFRMTAGVRQSKMPGKEAEAVLALARAAALDPNWRRPREALAGVPGVVRGWWHKADSQPSRYWREQMQAKAGRLEKGLIRAQEFLHSDRAAVLRGRHAHAFVADLGEGLALGPPGPGRDQICIALGKALDRASGAAGPDEKGPPRRRSRRSSRRREDRSTRRSRRRCRGSSSNGSSSRRASRADGPWPARSMRRSSRRWPAGRSKRRRHASRRSRPAGCELQPGSGRGAIWHTKRPRRSVWR